METTSRFLSSLEKAVTSCNLAKLKHYLNTIPSSLDQTEYNDSLTKANELLVRLEASKDEFHRELRHYITNKNLWGLLANAIYTTRKGVILIIDKASSLYLLKKEKLGNDSPTLNYLKEYTICNLFYWFFKQSILGFEDEYPTLELERRDIESLKKYGSSDWEKKERSKETDKNEFYLSDEGKAKYSDKTSEFYLRLQATDKPTKLASTKDIISEIYCYHEKFWYQDYGQPCIANIEKTQIYGYIGNEGLISLSQNLSDSNCPNLYPVRSHCSNRKNVLEQALDVISYLVGDGDGDGVDIINLSIDATEYRGTSNLETLVEIIEIKTNKQIILIDTFKPCEKVSEIFNEDEIYRPSKKRKSLKTDQTCFIYVYRTESSIAFIEPITFINLPKYNDDTAPIFKKRPLVKLLDNNHEIVTNFKKHLPECHIPPEIASDAIAVSPKDMSPSLKDVLSSEIIPATEKLKLIEDKSMSHSISKEKPSQDVAFFNLNDIGKELPIVDIESDKPIKMLLGNEYLLNMIAYRNLYEIDFPYNLTGRLSGDVLTNSVKICWLENDLYDNTTITSSQLGGSASIYECLSNMSSINKTPFYQLLEASVH